jgi:hypothetical protein
MAELQRNFLQGIMNKDLDPHFLPDGQYRDALNIIVGDSDGQYVSIEGSNNGAAQNYLGNTLMNSALGLTNAKCIGSLAHDAQNLIYWLVAADNADAIFEYNETLDLTTIVLKATKATPTTSSLLNFNKSFFVTGINYIEGLLFWTDNYNPPRRVTIDRAKNYGVDNFTEDDISVIVAPPLDAPAIALSNNGDSNNLEDKFLYFAYRYKYIDNEYSALSPFSPVAFLPKQFEYDYGVSENVSMTNSFNTVTLTYNRGGNNVTEVQLVFRDTRNINAYIIDNIQTRTLSSSQSQTYQFKNNKVYSILDPNQINRLFDNVPLRAKAQELIGVEIPTQVVIIDNNGTFLIAAFDKVKEVNPQLAQAFETRKMVYRLGMNGKVSSKAIHAALKNNEYQLVVENEAEGIFRMEPIQAVVGIDYPSNNSTDAQSIVFPSEGIPTDFSNVADRIEGILEEDLATVNNVEAYDEF